MINIFLVVFSIFCAWLAYFFNKVRNYQPEKRSAVGKIVKIITTDSGYIQFYVEFLDGEKTYTAKSLSYVVVKKKYDVGDFVNIGYYFSKAKRAFCELHDDSIPVKMSPIASILAAGLSIMFFIVFVYKMIPYFI